VEAPPQPIDLDDVPCLDALEPHARKGTGSTTSVGAAADASRGQRGLPMHPR
jgi:hypothetical protein